MMHGHRSKNWVLDTQKYVHIQMIAHCIIRKMPTNKSALSVRRLGSCTCKQRPIPQKILRCFSLKPRLHRLFMSKKTILSMQWHQFQRVRMKTHEGILQTLRCGLHLIDIIASLLKMLKKSGSSLQVVSSTHSII